MRTAAMVLISAALGSAGAAAQQVPPGPGPAGGRGGPPPDIALVERFDANRDSWLNRAERDAAREWLKTQPQPQRGGGGQRIGAVAPGGGGPPGGAPGGPPGGPPPGGGGRGGRIPFATGSAGTRLTPTDVRDASNAAFYDPKTLRTIFLQFADDDWDAELTAFKPTDVEVPATMIVDGKTYRDAGVSYRGASSFSMVPAGLKHSFNISTDLVHEDQALLGYRSLNLLNANSDPTFVRTALYSLIARNYLPAPAVNYARVAVNNENWGIYLNVQQFNREFVQEHYRTTGGARWKVPGSPGGRGGMEYLGDDAAPYRRLYEIKTKDDAKSWTGLINLFKVLNTTPPEQLEAALKPILNVEGVLRFLALDVALVNTDGYWTRASDYNIYQDTLGVFHVLPHDMNEALGTGGNVELDPLINVQDSTKPLRSKLLAVPALRERYLGYVRDIATNWLDWQKLEPMVRQHQALIAEHVKADTRKLYSTEAFETGVTDLQSFVERRRAFLLK